jgi:hypothetical protein
MVSISRKIVDFEYSISPSPILVARLGADVPPKRVGRRIPDYRSHGLRSSSLDLQYTARKIGGLDMRDVCLDVREYCHLGASAIGGISLDVPIY